MFERSVFTLAGNVECIISWGLRGNPYQNTRNYGLGRTLKTALQPQLIIHIVSHRFLLITLKLNMYDNKRIKRKNCFT